MAITKEQIIAAADKIVANGQNPTMEAIRQELGSGSYSTISPVLAEWKTRQTTAPIREPAPIAITSRLTDVGTEIWAIALEMTNARLTAEREALDEARTVLDADRAEAISLADRLTTELDEAEKKIKQLTERAIVAEAQSAELRAVADKARQDATTAHEEAARLAGQLAAHQEQSAALLARIAPSAVKAKASTSTKKKPVKKQHPL
jgi:alanyl-tRNA synthetase